MKSLRSSKTLFTHSTISPSQHPEFSVKRPKRLLFSSQLLNYFMKLYVIDSILSTMKTFSPQKYVKYPLTHAYSNDILVIDVENSQKAISDGES